jgi:hypothetical protein
MPYRDIKKKRANDRAYWRKVKGAGPASVSAQYNLSVGTVKDLKIKGPKHGLKIAVINDVQAMDGVPLEHLDYAGRYIADKQPDVIVCIGDFGDFPSLSRYERGTRHFEGRRYIKDIAAFHRAMELLMNPIRKASGYNPHCEFTLGNHEDHIERITVEDAKLEGLISLNDLKLADYGWRVHPFLQPVSIGGVAFCHYFPSGVMGKAITSAPALLRKLHMSAVAGHQQGREIAYSRRADGGNITAIISGSFYQHKYSYLSPFTNAHWRGMWFLHQVKDGALDEMALSIDFLKRRYGKK